MLDGVPTRKGTRLTAGQELRVRVPPSDQAHPNPDLSLEVTYQTDDLVVVNKPAGLPSAARDGSDRRTAANALVYRFPEMAGVGYSPREPGLLHRLDNDTSGALLAARSPTSWQTLRTAMDSGGILKQYLAVTSPPPHAQGTIEVPLTPNGRRVRVDPRGERPARTDYQLLQSVGPFSLLLVSARRAYRHQVRVHLASVGAALVGDHQYGGQPALKRHALHAWRIAFDGTPELPGFDVRVALPLDLRTLLMDLGAREPFEPR